MKLKAISWAAVAASALLGLGVPAFGQVVSIDFTGVANPSVQALGAYAGYYTGTVNGVASTPGFICDDYNNEIFLPSESWDATARSFSSLVTQGASGTLFGNTIGLSGYAALAYLANLMSITPPSGQGDISAAIWYIGSLNSGNVVPWSNLDATAQGYVNYLLGGNGMKGIFDGTYSFNTTATQAALDELTNSSLWLYTPTGQNIQPAGDPFPQEFIGNVAVSVPEGGSAFMYLLMAGSFCFGAVFFNRKRQLAKGIAA